MDQSLASIIRVQSPPARGLNLIQDTSPKEGKEEEEKEERRNESQY